MPRQVASCVTVPAFQLWFAFAVVMAPQTVQTFQCCVPSEVQEVLSVCSFMATGSVYVAPQPLYDGTAVLSGQALMNQGIFIPHYTKEYQSWQILLEEEEK